MQSRQEQLLTKSMIKIEPFTIVGISEIGPSSFNNSEGSGAKFADTVWQKFIPMVLNAGLSSQRVMYGVSWPADANVPPQEIHYFAGFELKPGEPSAGFKSLDITGGNYFAHTYIGSMANIDLGFMDAYTVALPGSGLSNREGQHLEVYPANYDPAAPEITFQILIPVE